ncbi:hypothetical protein DACRYDRAFT_109190 [Dacryopinax primogenitus]|uniref:Uncharacterized protein n=1 Tax=Dacryopinax primogenitus (strain DJM 731) TaxID=1858805 RepID=M5FSL9_DACPD|nr:uncharacterized protein DACRYDRAFT_109190 [Dacryopinax primogenitus]EJU00471.1 hypothetical protein DACRYDRAFT_109190 [Dacryopinax primogenitus]
MATATVDSELMYHQVAAQPFQVLSGAPFSCIRDAQDRPLTLSVGTDSCLYALKADPTSENEHININVSSLIGATNAVAHFGVSQDVKTKAVYLVVATAALVYVLPPFKPDDLVAANASTLLKPLPCTQAQSSTEKVTRILLGDVITSGTYPLAIAAFTDAAGNADIARVLVSGSTSWAWDGQLGMPEEATGGMLDLCPGNCALGVGIYCLYVNAGVTNLMFQTTEAGARHYKFDLQVPQAAQRIITYKESNNLTHLLVLGGGLWHIPPDQTIHSGSQATQLSSDPLYATCAKLYLSQYGTDFSAWFLSGTTLAYQQGIAGSAGILDGTPVPLLNKFSGPTANFAAIIDPTTASQSLVVMDTTSMLTIMEQPSDTYVWKTTPFLVKQLDKVIDFSAYTSRVLIVDSQGWPQGNKPFNISTTAGWLTVIINGGSSLLGTDAIQVTTDSNGAITIIFPTSDLDAYELRVQDASGSSILGGQTFIFDPSDKVQTKLKAITTGDDLRNAKTADGTPILQGSTASPDDIDNAGKWIGEMSNQAIEAIQLARAQGTMLAADIDISASDIFWEGWNWVCETADSIKDFVVETSGAAWHFVVTIAGKVWDFILDTAAKVAKACSLLLQKIGAAWDTLVQWLGYIFDWQDILQTKDAIKSMVNGLLTFGENYLNKEAQQLGTYFENIQTQISQSFTIAPTASATPSSQNLGGDPSATTANKSAQTSAPANYGNYQLDHGGASDASILTPMATDASLSNLYTQKIAPLLNQLLTDAENIGSQIVNLFNNALDITVADIQAFAQQFAISFLQLIKDLVTNVIALAADIVGGLRTILNANFQIPVIGGILESFGVGPYSILDVVALLLAIPTTVLAKIITGSSPTLSFAFDYQKLVDGTLDGTTTNSFRELAAYVDIPAQYIQGILKVKDIATSTIPAEGAPPTPLSYFGLVKDLVVKGISYPSDRAVPGWEFRISGWSMLIFNVVMKGICKRAGVSATKALACFDAFVALVNFSLSQASYGMQLNTSYTGRNDVIAAMGVANATFLLLAGVGSPYGILAPDPIDKAIASVVVMGAEGISCVLKGVKQELCVAQTAINVLDQST